MKPRKGVQDQSDTSTAKKPGDPLRRTLSVEEMGRILGIGRTRAYALARSGEIPAIRLGKRLLVPKAAIDRLLGELNGPTAAA